MLDLEPLTVGPEGIPELGAVGRRACGTPSTATPDSPGDDRRAPARLDRFRRGVDDARAATGICRCSPGRAARRSARRCSCTARATQARRSRASTTRARTRTRRRPSSAGRCATTSRRRSVDLRRAGADARTTAASSAPSGADVVRGARAPRFRATSSRCRSPASACATTATAADAWQASASAYSWRTFGAMRLDALLDWGLDRPDVGPTRAGRASKAALRSADRRAIGWLRSEMNQREEPPGAPVEVSSPWLFGTAGSIGRLGIARVGGAARRLLGGDLRAHSRRAARRTDAAGGRDERRLAPVRHVDVRLRLPPDAPRSLAKAPRKRTRRYRDA